MLQDFAFRALKWTDCVVRAFERVEFVGGEAGHQQDLSIKTGSCTKRLRSFLSKPSYPSVEVDFLRTISSDTLKI